MTTLPFRPATSPEVRLPALRSLLDDLKPPFAAGDDIGIKLHWGEQGNLSFLHPDYAREIARWLQEKGARPFRLRHHRSLLRRTAQRSIGVPGGATIAVMDVTTN